MSLESATGIYWHENSRALPGERRCPECTAEALGQPLDLSGTVAMIRTN